MSASNLIAFVDTETLGLDPDRHAIWEVGLVLYDPDECAVVSEHMWQIWLTTHQIADGDPVGMEIGRWGERYDRDTATVPPEFLVEFIRLTKGAHLAGAVVSFDEERLRRMALRSGFEPGWHYHLIDVEVMALGALAASGESFPLPWKSDPLSARFGVTVSKDDRHTALGDAWWALRLYEAIGRCRGDGEADR